LKTKAANPVTGAFKEISSDGCKPKNLQCDEGTEILMLNLRDYVEIIILIFIM
jgi:hypothetical protein